MKVHKISSKELTFKQVNEILTKGYKLELSADAIKRIQKCRDYLDKKMENPEKPIYGVTTGFGSLCDHSISKEDLSTLQKNLVMSHACGTGEMVPEEIIRLMLLLKVQSLSYGNSGVQVVTVQRLIDFFNNDVLPVVYNQGSLGASGDLAPLANLMLPLLGLGEVHFEGKIVPAEKVLKKFGWEPITLQSKEGLALLNGTQFMSSYGTYVLLKAFRLSYLADLIGTVSLEAFDGRIEPFFDQVHQIRHHNGQIVTAKRVREFTKGSELIVREKKHVQDPYSFRCMPQVHGASKDAIDYVASVFSEEINAVTDNPTIFPDEDLVISAGNFHGQPLGFMIPQYAAASIVSQSKQLCTPASVDSIESSQGQEDHVSMGANAATKALRVAENLERVLAIELFNATQALEFRRPLKSSPIIEKFVAEYRKQVEFVRIDKVMYTEIAKSVQFVKDYPLAFDDLQNK